MGWDGTLWAESGTDIPTASECQSIAHDASSINSHHETTQKVYREGIYVNGLKYATTFAGLDDLGIPKIIAKKAARGVYIKDSLHVVVLGIGESQFFSCMTGVDEVHDHLAQAGY